MKFQKTQAMQKPGVSQADNFTKFRVQIAKVNVQNAKVIWSQAKETKEEKERQAELKKQAKQKHKKRMLSLLDLKPLPEVETPNLQNCLINCQKES